MMYKSLKYFLLLFLDAVRSPRWLIQNGKKFYPFYVPETYVKQSTKFLD